MINNKSNVKKIMIIWTLIIVLMSSMFSFDKILKAEVFEKIEITFCCDSPFKIINDDGETIIVDEEGNISGTMDILKNEIKRSIPNIYHILTVRKSDKYIIEQELEGDNHITIDYLEDNSKMIILNTSDVCKAEIQLMPVGRINLQGNTQKYSISACMGAQSGVYDIDGTLYKAASFEDKGKQLIVNGVYGKTAIEIESADEKIDSKGTYYFFGDEAVLGYNSDSTFVKNAVKLKNKEAKSPITLYVRPVNNNKNMFLTWTKVKKARSYIVYKEDSVTKKYKKVAIRNGKGSNYYNEVIGNNTVYKYKVKAKGKKNGKGKTIGKLSYEVFAVPKDNVKKNVSQVFVNKSKLSIKTGKKKKLNANIAEKKEELINSNIRWYSSNKKIARVNKKTGKVTAIKKGKCKVWAKAHNGKNSKKVVVRVK